jgi:signal transduction histidine kinase
VLLLVFDFAIWFALFNSAKARAVIVAGINRISGGELHSKVAEQGLHGDNLTLARAVNQIGETVSEAVAISLRDERMKADLITNVSHDIKTPLTSIINYVDLLKRENIADETIKGYIEILDNKSQRLKQLTDDLVEASKISSGNLTLQLGRIGLTELVNQMVGEFSERFAERKLSLNVKIEEENLFIKADSRHIWRVIENLGNNIVKYALPGTRVYIDITKKDKERVELSFKNISEQPLNFAAEELTERFIRGDVARSTEGSGLGLSIAKSLTELQEGSFAIQMDGDLFKVVLGFALLG